MITDPVFYELFAISPETFFLLLGLSADAAREMAHLYQYDAIEFKQTAHRADGVFRPRQPDLPLYFLEVQFYRLPSVFADLLVKAYTYLKLHDPGQPFCGVVLFGSRILEPERREPYQPLLDAGLIRTFYLDEMPELENAPIGLSILYLIGQSDKQAPIKARELIARTNTEIDDAGLRDNLLELIETIILYKLPQMTREEIQAMFLLHDIRKSRVYQEAKEEGIKEGIEKGHEEGAKKERARILQEKLQSVVKMAALQMAPEKIADILGLDLEVVHSEISRHQPNS